MKKLATIVIAFHLSLFSIDGAFAQWLHQNSGTNNDLTSICFIDNDNGWAVGSEGIILHTSDGGDNWFQQSSGTDNYLRSVSFIDSLNGWIAGGMYNHPELGIILRTCNGGFSWEEVYIDSACWLTDIYFTDSLHGGAVGAYHVGWGVRGKILHSDDGGITWYKQGPYVMPLQSIHFTDPDTGWVVGGYIAGSSGYPNCYIAKTTNGGITWEEQINTGDIYSPLKSVCFTDTENGWAVGNNRIFGFELTPSILRTNNGGIQWDSTFYNATNGTEYALESVCFINNYTGWAVGGMWWWTSHEWSLILHTQDGGDSWIEQKAGTDLMLNSVCFINAEEGWIAADRGTILHTENGGVGLKELSLSNKNAITIYQYPNPFTSTTILSYTLEKPAKVTINIFNPQGQLIEKIEQKQAKGEQQIHWNAEGLPTGMYYFRIQAGDKIGGGKMVKY